MYERSASVLEKHLSKTLLYISELKENYDYYKELIELLENYQNASEKEITYEKEYKMVLSRVEDIQKKQKDISKYNVELENKRNRLFSDTLKSPEEIESYIVDIEKILKENSEKLIELRIDLIKYLKEASERKASLKEIQETIRVENRNFRKSLREITNSSNVITAEQVSWLENTIKDYKKIEDDAIEIMMQNGMDEKVPFNEEVIRNGAILGVDIAKKQCEAYIYIYKQTNKLMEEISANKVKLETRKKAFVASDAKIKFLEAEKEYLNRFLDNERSTAVHSIEEHDEMMKDAMEKFTFDISKINKLYNLLVKETKGKATKEDFEELYDASHYREIEEKELKFQRETKKLGIGGVVSPYYWRREGIRSIYDVFGKIISPVEEKRIENNEIKIETVERIPSVNKEKRIEDYFDDEDVENTDEEDEEIDSDSNVENTQQEDEDEEKNDSQDDEDYDEDYDDEDDEEYEYNPETNSIEVKNSHIENIIENNYKDRLKKLLEQNEASKKLKKYNEDDDEKDTYDYDKLVNEHNKRSDDDYEEDDEDEYDEDYDDDEYDDDDDDNVDSKRGKHSWEDNTKSGRHSDADIKRGGIFNKLKNIFDKSKDDDDYDEDEYEDEEDYEDDDYEEEEEEKVTKKSSKKTEEIENPRKTRERSSNFDEKMRVKLEQNPKYKRALNRK